MGYIRVICKLFSKSFVREGFIMIMTFFIFLALLVAVSPLMYTITLTSDAKASLPDNTVYFFPSDRITNLLEGRMGSEDQKLEATAFFAEAMNDEEAIGVGRAISYVVGYEGKTYKLIGYNEDMLRNTTLPLKEGRWFTDRSADDPLPVIVGGDFKSEVNLMSTFEMDFASQIGGSIHTCQVIGKLDGDDMYLELSYGESDPTMYSIAILHKWMSNQIDDGVDGIILYPAEAVAQSPELTYSPACLFFYDDSLDLSRKVAHMRETLNLGTYDTVAHMTQVQYARTIYLNNTEIVTAFSLLLFCLLGLGGYSILSDAENRRVLQVYYICGMTKHTAAITQIVSRGILTILPALASLLLLRTQLPDFASLISAVYAVMWCALSLVMAGPIVSIVVQSRKISYNVEKR